MTLKQLKEKYPFDAVRFTAAPFRGCPACKGTGEHPDTRGLPVWCACLTMKGWDKDRIRRVMQDSADRVARLVREREAREQAGEVKRRQAPLKKSSSKKKAAPAPPVVKESGDDDSF